MRTLGLARGRLKQTSYVKGEETRFSVTLACEEFSRLARSAQDGED